MPLNAAVRIADRLPIANAGLCPQCSRLTEIALIAVRAGVEPPSWRGCDRMRLVIPAGARDKTKAKCPCCWALYSRAVQVDGSTVLLTELHTPTPNEHPDCRHYAPYI